MQPFIEYGANVNAKGEEYGTALIAAVHGSHKDVVKILLENGADVNEREAREDPTALYVAASSRHSEVMKLSLDRGADSNAEGG